MLRKAYHIVKRLICLVFNRHEWDERTIIRWCTKCMWVEVKDPKGWTMLVENYDDDWMTPENMKAMADELLEYLELTECNN